MRIFVITLLFSPLLWAQTPSESAKFHWTMIQVTSSNGEEYEIYQNQFGARIAIKRETPFEIPNPKIPASFRDQMVTQAYLDKKMEVTLDDHGNTVIKKRTPKSENKTDPAEFQNYNLQRVFNVGIGFGSQILSVSNDAQERIRNGDTSQAMVDVQVGIRLPYPFAKRFLFGASTVARNGLRAPSDSVPWAPPDGDGFTTYPLASETYRTIFAEYDVLVLPGHDAKVALSAGVYKGFARAEANSGSNYRYSDQGVTGKARFFLGSGSFDNGMTVELSPFVAFKYGSNKMHAVYAGLTLGFGAEMKKKTKVEK